MLTRRLIVLLKKARLALPVLKRPLYGVAVPRAVAVAASYVVVLFLPLLCDVRASGRPVSGAPAKVRTYYISRFLYAYT
ncbi:hypothetical protein L249_8128 [Ophiocordyceps polyrhachis-furcata BCC 54312]|uniref:Uncharacterized protein n=1 Tax=Ophiocordyceps polyrhachis-furcata BCC 54312 TaxID=1330021 RepID=A0A367LI83_9HYPO|nr:hypothetical protein L249_8128 [Ophiocordyceps polyrhachis-furcata BCC 54312]